MKAFSFAVIVMMFFTGAAVAQVSQWGGSDHVRVRIMSHVSSIGGTRDLYAALEVELSEGWHTYWRVSGDTGLPPRFDWAGSENVEHVAVLWPAPTRKNEQGFITFGYDGRVVLPLDITLTDENVDTVVDVSAQVMVCKDICIPQRLNAVLRLPAGGGESAPLAIMLERAREGIPSEDSETLRIADVVLDGDALEFHVAAANGIDPDMDVFAVLDGAIGLTAPPEIEVIDENNVAIRIPLDADFASDAPTLSITLVNGDEAIEYRLK